MLVYGLNILVVESLSVRSSSGPSGASGASGLFGFGGRGADGGATGFGAAGRDGGAAGLGAAGGGPAPARRIGAYDKPNAHVVDDAPSKRSRSEGKCIVDGCAICNV